MAGPLGAFVCAGGGDLAELEVVGGEGGLVDDVLRAVGVFEPRGIDGVVGCAVALDEGVYQVVDAGDGGADGAVLGCLSACLALRSTCPIDQVSA